MPGTPELQARGASQPRFTAAATPQRIWTGLSNQTRARAKSLLVAVMLVTVIGGALGARFWYIRESLPYCQHVDERTWVQIAMRITRDGDLNPHRFTKPSMMVYLTTAGLALGLLRAGGRAEAKHPADLGKRAFPYYRLPRAVEVAKRLFALASVAALGMAGVCARVLARRRSLLVTAPLLGSLSAGYLYHSWAYINADILGTFFVLATITHLVVEHGRQRTGVKRVGVALLQGLLAGLALGSKYNLYPIVLPYTFYVLFFVRDRLVSRMLTFVLATFAGFVLSTPYALLSMNEFLADATREAKHYATNHKGVFTDPGWPMFKRYLEDLRTSYGAATLVAALFGLFAAFSRDPKLTIVVFSFPVTFLWYMSSQRVFFERNQVSIHLFVAIACAIGLLEALRFTKVGIARSRKLSSLRPWQRNAVCVAPFALFVLFAPPWKTVQAAYSPAVEARNTVSRFLPKELRAGTEVLLDEQLLMNTSLLEEKLKVTPFQHEDEQELERFLNAPAGTVLVIPVRDGALVDRLVKSNVKVLLRAGKRYINDQEGAVYGDPELVVFQR